MPKLPILGVIFDLDGTAADTMWLHEEIEAHLLKEHGIVKADPQELTRRFAGVSLQETFRAVFAEERVPLPDLDALSERKFQILHSRSSEFRRMPGIGELTAMLRTRDVALAIASSSRLVTIELVLEKIDLRHRFKAVASSKECEKGKPAPDVFLLAASRLGIPPSNCVVIGDSISDMMGARAANMRRIALWKHAPRELLANLVVRDLREIPDEFFT